MLGGGIARPPSAEACAGPTCVTSTIRAPLPAGAAVPANVPALVVLPPVLQAMDPMGLRLRTADGASVEASLLAGPHRSGVLIPAAPLVPGTGYLLESNTPCRDMQPSPAISVAFTAGPAVALPTASGSLSAGAEQQTSFEVWGGALCSVGVEGSVLPLRFTPAPELVPFLPWVHWTLEVDGQTWATAPHGAVDAAGGVMSPNRFGYPHDLLSVYAVCHLQPSNDRPQDKGIPPGQHVATLRPVLEQSATPLPALETPFTLTCPKETPDPVPGDRGCSQVGGGLTALGVLATLGLWRRSRQSRP
ncbi:hypothetical protein [Corallococcus silvisoli]|uniref:hypothetical protein n=1 Tax=Corallococcus silvisoli TaxID=2697031 RepID=UPI0013781777|nr:hypothetical protein [Corallococcus silvisoli]NBD12251.1 hypothetical protein [Corallococcus silvisoli]